MHARVLAVLLAAGLAAGAAHATGTDEPFPPAQQGDAERLRQAGEQACREMMDTAALLSERLQEVGAQMEQLMVETRERVTRDMAPAMRDLAERLNQMARELEQQQPPRKQGS